MFHLSTPVRDLAAAVEFYVTQLDARVGRQTDSFVDVFVFGAQLTLQNAPHDVPDVMPRSRHFGATIPWTEWEALAARFAGSFILVEPATLSYVGELREQAKLMLVDPSGNFIEIKAYRHPEHVLVPSH